MFETNKKDCQQHNIPLGTQTVEFLNTNPLTHTHEFEIQSWFLPPSGQSELWKQPKSKRKTYNWDSKKPLW